MHTLSSRHTGGYTGGHNGKGAHLVSQRLTRLSGVDHHQYELHLRVRLGRYRGSQLRVAGQGSRQSWHM